jgi:hypothetical protein
MMKRVLSLTAALAVVVFVSAAFASAAKAADSTVVGTIAKVSSTDNTITVTDKDGKDHALTMAKDAKITCDGKDCKLADLAKGTAVTVTLNANDKTTAQQIDAKTK